MIHLPESSTSRSVDTSVVPMINIVFLLLLYFLVAGRLTTDDGPAVQLPMGGDTKQHTPATFIIHVLSDNTITSEGKPLNERELTQYLETAGTHAAAHIVVRADGTASAAALHQILNAGRVAGIPSIELATVRPPTP